MSYIERLSLREPPFGTTADPGFLYGSDAVQAAMGALATALEAGEPVLMLNGDAGTGKTALCRALVGGLDRQTWVVAYLGVPETDGELLALAVGRALGARMDGVEGAIAAQRALGLHLLGLARAGRRALVVIDECHALGPEVLEQVRQLTNLETPKRPLLQVLLCGAPSPAGAPASGRLAQRVAFEHALKPLSSKEIPDYFAHRMRVAGYSGAPLLTGAAAKVVYRMSAGVPRLVNALSHQALLVMEGDGPLTPDHVRKRGRGTPALTGTARAPEVGHEWFWRCTAALLSVGILWTAWVAYELRPRELVTPQAYAIASEGRLTRAPEVASTREAPEGIQPEARAVRDPEILRALGIPNAKIAAYSPDFALSLARLQLQRENYAGALAALDAAGSDVASRPDYLYLRGTVLRGLKQDALAEETFRRALGATQAPGTDASAR